MTDDDSRQRMNLDLIWMVQRARMLHDEEARPSALAAVYWIEAKRKTGDYPAPTAKCRRMADQANRRDGGRGVGFGKGCNGGGQAGLQVQSLDAPGSRSSGLRRAFAMRANL